MARLTRISIMILIGAVVGASLAAAGIASAERFGAQTVERGRVVDRSVEERRVCRYNRNVPGPACRIQRTSTVVGERVDGSRWEVIGDRPHDITRGHTGEVVITTSDVTGRVIAVTADEESWRYPDWWLFGLAILGGTVAVGSIVVVSRGRGNLARRVATPSRLEWSAIVPGGVLGVVFVVNAALGDVWRTDHGDDTSSNGGSSIDFLVDRFDFLEAADAARAGAGISVNELFGVALDARIATVDPEQLTEGARQAWLDADTFAIPLWQEGERRGPSRLVRYFILDGDEQRESIGCPPGLIEFPTPAGPPSTYGGFVCFDTDLDGGAFLVTEGTLQIDFDRHFPDYPRPDGTVVSAS